MFINFHSTAIAARRLSKVDQTSDLSYLEHSFHRLQDQDLEYEMHSFS